jgi:hypothetical protein
MSLPDWINLSGTVITILCTGITLWLAKNVDTVRRKLERRYRKIFLSEVRSSLEEAQRLGRTLQASLTTGGRGQNIGQLVFPIRHQLDAAIHRLPLKGPDASLRTLILSAQEEVVAIETAASGQDRSDRANAFNLRVQDAVSTCRQYFEDVDLQEV